MLPLTTSSMGSGRAFQTAPPVLDVIALVLHCTGAVRQALQGHQGSLWRAAHEVLRLGACLPSDMFTAKPLAVAAWLVLMTLSPRSRSKRPPGTGCSSSRLRSSSPAATCRLAVCAWRCSAVAS